MNKITSIKEKQVIYNKMNNHEYLISIADILDQQGDLESADVIDNNWKEFLELLEQGKLDFDFLFSGGVRDVRKDQGASVGHGEYFVQSLITQDKEK